MKKLPPHNLEYEEAVIGSLLIDPDLTPHVANMLSGQDFFIVKHGWVFDTIIRMYQAGSKIDFLTVCKELSRDGKLDQIGGQAFLSHLISETPTSVHIVYYAEDVRNTAIRRRMIDVASSMAQHAYDESNHIDHALSDALTSITAMRVVATRPQQKVELLNASTIMATQWPDPSWAIPGLLPMGLTMLAGKPKCGKSWLSLQIACAIATGGIVLNQRVQPGPVLYLALEDYPKRLAKRMAKQQWPKDCQVDFITMKTYGQQVGDLAAGGLDRLITLINAMGYRMVVIDTFSKAIGMYMRVKEDLSASIMTRVLSPIQEMANELDISVLMIDHHTKATGDADAITDIMGSVAKGATLDTAWGLYRERGHRGAKLQVIGRDIEEEKTLVMEFDQEYGIWHYTGDSDSLEMTARRQEILLALQDLGRATNDTLAEAVGQDNGNTYKRLNDMVAVGLIRRELEGSKVYYKRVMDQPMMQ